jgi:DNA-binding NtrC family response regulator
LSARVLIADDERGLRETLVRFFRSRDLGAEGVASGAEVLARIGASDVLICDLALPDVEGIAFVAEVRRRRPELPIIILTGHGSVTLAVDAMRAGAANFLTKPIALQDLEQAVWSAIRRGAVTAAAKVGGRSGEIFIGESSVAEALRLLTLRFAASNAPVLITGESGAGKEVIARSIHAQGRRAAEPFVAVNCGAIPDTLVESELFGHTRGAFTGATQAQVGRFVAAGNGTILLDEVGELPLQMQVKLLRVLQDHTVTPLGSQEPRAIGARVIAATNRDLEGMVVAGRFRQDLYYRLNVLSIDVPPLRERGDDILELARTFLRRAVAAESKAPMTIDAEAAQCLRRYSWPGNVRELEHAVRQATVLATGPEITLAVLPVKVRAAYHGPEPVADAASAVAAPTLGDDGIDLDATLASIERHLIEQALERTGGNKNRAAALLRLPRSTLLERLKRVGVASDPGVSGIRRLPETR